MVTLASFQDRKVPVPGYGAMSLSHAYGSARDDESLQVLSKAVELGCTFWDTAVVYGMGHNETLIGRFFSDNPGTREKIFVASKCAFDIDFEKKAVKGITNKAEHIRSYLEESTRRLGSAPDLYYLHRRDPETTLEESIGTLDALRKEGKIKYIGLSEVSAETLRAACKVAHVDALQIEYSAFCLDNEANGLISTAKELGVAIIAFSPLGAGFLTGKYKTSDSMQDPLRSSAGRFSEENLKVNLKIVEAFEAMSAIKGCSPAQLALAWAAAQGTLPIPGTRSVERLEENWGATEVVLTDNELKEIKEIQRKLPTKGTRWDDNVMATMGK